MFGKVVSCFIGLALVTLVQGDKHEELLDLGYDYVPGVGYYAFGVKNNWTYAQNDCMTSKARLAVIDSEEERQAIVSFLSKYTNDTYVFGGYTNDYESQYVTIEGVPLVPNAYNKWETGKPSGMGRRCVGINTKTGELADLDCSDLQSYVCEHQLWNDYDYFKGLGYYKMHLIGQAWADAYTTCKNEGADLLVIDSQAEATAVMQIYNMHPDLPNADDNDYVYVGFRGVFQFMNNKTYEGTYLTIYGNSVSDLEYVKWLSSAEPNSAFQKNCGSLYRTNATYAMQYCNSKFAFFCEKKFQVFNRA